MPGPVTDPRAACLRQRYLDTFGGEELPVPIEAIAQDLLGLYVDEVELDGISGMLLPADRHVYVNARDVAPRRSFGLLEEPPL